MWNEPYLETCCRSALHRLCLAGESGRPAGLADDPCLARMERMGLVCQSAEGRFVVTEAGVERHASEVMGRCASRHSSR
ncbi:hypothetical protein [Acetobacter vaccinii]|uniref:Uncharacterized protein n=1 Tax=Acetobacter vaccinii TaxID=2592655 RepID=A0A5C1YQ74_9PROT|nr:hypothetical protein [Acetobacter vaccinii]QEO18504.1 hypothetical protein FLP30_01940 [Acetobacter vaccinii]